MRTYEGGKGRRGRRARRRQARAQRGTRWKEGKRGAGPGGQAGTPRGRLHVTSGRRQVERLEWNDSTQRNTAWGNEVGDDTGQFFCTQEYRHTGSMRSEFYGANGLRQHILETH
jgi:hypothetical protein